MNLTRTFAAVTLAAATFAGVYTGTGSDTDHLDNGAVRLADDAAMSAGVCREYVGTITIYSCAPIVSPNGAAMVGRVEEDGSAGYADGLVYDAENGTFRPRIDLS